jgi:hypothetical protein
VVVAIVNMTNDRFDLVSGDCVGAMSNSVFEAEGVAFISSMMSQ